MPGTIRLFRLSVVLLAPLLLGAAPSGRDATAADRALVQQDDGLRHAASGMRFPPRVAGFEIVEQSVYDAAGRDISVGYNLYRPDAMIVATVYVYPAPGAGNAKPDADTRAREGRAELERRKQEVTGANPAAVLLEEGPTTLSQPSGSIDGWRASYRMTGKFGRETEVLRSELYVFWGVGKTWALEYRISFPERLGPRPEIGAFMQALPITIPAG